MVLKKHIFFILALLLSLNVFAQNNEIGVPYIENITSSTTGYYGELYDIVQDENNIFYFAHDSGVLIYNGASWTLLETHGRPCLCKRKNGTIVVAATNFLGQISTNTHNQKEIIPFFEDTISHYGSISAIIEFQESLFFLAHGKVYEYKGLTDEMPIQIDLPYVNSLLCDRSGLIAVTSSQSFICNDTKKGFINKKDCVIDGLLRTNEYLIIHTQNQFYATNSLTDSWNKLSQIPHIESIIALAKTIDNNICIANSKGLSIYTSMGQELSHIDVTKGLTNNTIHSIYVDTYNNIWTTHPNGISRIEANISISYFSKKNGLNGTVTTVERNGNTLYIGTTEGLFAIRNNSCQQLSASPCVALNSYKNTLLVANNDGLFIGENCQNKIDNQHLTQAFFFKNYIIAVSNSHITFWKDNSQSETPAFSLTQQFDVPDITINSMAHETSADTNLLFGTEHDGVWVMTHQKDDLYNQITHCSWPGLPQNTHKVYVYQTTKGILFSTAGGFFRSDEKNGFFYKDAKIQLPPDMTDIFVKPIVEDTEKNLWLAFHHKGIYANQMAVAWNSNNFERYTLITTPFAKIRDCKINVIYPEKNSIVWLGGEHGLIRMDFNKIAVRKYLANVIFTKIFINGDSLLPIQQEKIELPYNTKSIAFNFVSTEYENHNDILYTYYLEGEESIWSSPTKQLSKEYTNLPAGTYTFHVKAQRDNGTISEETTYTFEIHQHPLLSVWAIIIYLIIITLLILKVLKLRSKHLAHEHEIVQKLIDEKAKEIRDTSNKKTIKENEITNENAETENEIQSKEFELATVLIADFKGFTKIAETMSAESVVQELGTFFSEFDQIIARYNIEKIKTMGDSYMCAGGIPKKNLTNPVEVVAAALEIQYRLQTMQNSSPDNTWKIRIGIHTGHVITGSVGGDTQSFDIWGDGVNTADYMESEGEGGRVNISETTYERVRDFFDCEYRGKISVKGKDEKFDMYFVNGFKQEYTSEEHKYLPNKAFTYKFALLQLKELEEKIYKQFKNELPQMYFYHCLKHTQDVVAQTEIIAQAEKISDEDLYLVKTAALFHDAGYLRTNINHHQASIEIAKEILTKERFSATQITKICQLIESLNNEQPKDLLEMILRDANFDYLGREDYETIARNLYKENLELKMVKKNEFEWLNAQLQFLQNHSYYTNYSRSHRNQGKVRQIQNIQEKLIKYNI